jgi:hypothetical protein
MAETRGRGGEYRSAAWSEPVISLDRDVGLTDKHIYDNKPDFVATCWQSFGSCRSWAFLSARQHGDK